jgi:hypothetical protein
MEKQQENSEAQNQALISMISLILSISDFILLSGYGLSQAALDLQHFLCVVFFTDSYDLLCENKILKIIFHDFLRLLEQSL